MISKRLQRKSLETASEAGSGESARWDLILRPVDPEPSGRAIRGSHGEPDADARSGIASQSEAGVIFLAASIPLALAGPLSGRIGERFDIPRSILTACGFGAAGLLLLSAGPSLAGLLAAFVLDGGGYGFGWSMASVGTQVAVPRSELDWRRGSRWRY